MSKAFSKGSICPVLSPGKLRLYSMRFCPFAKRSLIVLNAKNIPHEVVNINLKEKPEWLFEKNPLGKVPALEFEDNKMILFESLIICDYLDEAYPGPRNLHFTDPYERARDRALLEIFNRLATKMIPLKNGTDKNESVKAWESVSDELTFWEDILKSRKSDFFAGSKAGMLDYMIWPWFEGMKPLAEVYSLKGELPSKDQHPTLHKWVDRMNDDDAIKKLALPIDVVKKFIRSKHDGNSNFDAGL